MHRLGIVPGKRSIPTLLVLFITLVLAGCGSSSADADPDESVVADDPGAARPDTGDVADGPDDELPAALPLQSLPKPRPGQIINPLTGYPVAASLAAQRPFLVAIDNLRPARPQYGLSRADVVYQLPAEGGVTRLLGLYWAGAAEQIGPIRSSRHYFLDLVLEWQAVWVHVGGSPQHYEQVDRLGIKAIDDLRGGAGGVFWRDSNKKRPHNLFTASDRIRDQIDAKGWNESRPSGAGDALGGGRFAVISDLPAGDEASNFVIKWPGGSSAAEAYEYDAATGTYRRLIGGEVQLDALTGRPLVPTNIIVQFARATRIAGDSEGRLDVDLVGDGRALVFNGGRVREARWSKAQRAAGTVFAEADGKPLVLVPGQTWILIVPTGTEVALAGAA